MDDCDALTARIEATCQRIMAQFDRIDAQLTAILHHPDGRRRLPGAPMPVASSHAVLAVNSAQASVERHQHIRERLTAARREAERREAQNWAGRLQVELEKLLPADVPLHKRGFGVMEDE